MSSSKLKMHYLEKIFEEYTDEQHGLTCSEIISKLAEYDISAERKGLYHDIELLRSAGFEIEKRNSAREVTYHYINRKFSLPELKLLVDVVASSRFITEKQSRELIGKIEKLGSKEQGRLLQRNVILQDRPKTSNNSSIKNMGILNEAINENKKICFEYLKWDHRKKLVKPENGDKKNISPCFVMVSNDKYYLVAWDEAAERIKHYRIDKMKNITITDERAIRVPEVDSHQKMVAYCNRIVDMYSGEKEVITFECDEINLGIILDKFGTTDVTIKPVKNANGKYESFVTVDFSPTLMGWVAGVSEKVKLIGTEKCLNKYKEFLRSGLNE
jgi:predicted DNA-binding transcriptional regulator YafY